MMENLEKVEKIREKTGVTYEDAKNALEACNYDMLDAMVYLEKLGKVAAPNMSCYTTGANAYTQASNEFARAQENYSDDCKRTGLGHAIDKFIDWCGRVLKKSCETTFVVSREDKKLAEIPVLVLVLLLLFAFWVTIPLLIIGMFFGFKYNFRGVNELKVNINEMCDKASDVCNNIKNDIKGDKKDE